VSHDHYGSRVASRSEFISKTREALAQLKASHTGYYTPSDPRYFGLLSIFGQALGVRSTQVDSIGADFTDDGFARVIFPGGPAEKAGLLRGDQVLKADGKDYETVLSRRPQCAAHRGHAPG
jgi:carboxyl-terminal processing protease